MSVTDRMSRDYNPKWDLDLEVGAQGELFVARISDAVRDGTAEVKTDEKALLYGNVYLEYQCQYRGEWKNSGIATTEAKIWCHVIGEAMVAAPVERVREIALYYKAMGYTKECKRGSHPTRGVAIPIGLFLEKLASGITPADEQLLAAFRQLPEGEL